MNGRPPPNPLPEGEGTRPHPGPLSEIEGVHPITLEVVRNAIHSITEEMRVIVMRSARSPLLKEAGDLSCVLTDARGRMIAQGSNDNPMHLGVMGFTVKELLKRIPPERMHDGDVFFTNSPAVGGNHLPDVKAIQPVFSDGQLAAFAVNLSHWPDVGGALPGSYVPWATELAQEGLHLTPLRLFDAAGPIRETLDFVLANLRGPVERMGDIFAQRAATAVAAQRLQELFARYGSTVVQACFERFVDEADVQMRAALRNLPDGTYHGEDFLDDDGLGHGPIAIRVAVTIDGDTARFDFSGTDPQAPGPVNTTYFIACSGVYYVCKALLAPTLPANEGCYRALEVVVPPGTVLNPTPEAPVVGGNHETSQRVADAVFKAFAQVLPDRVVAGGITTSGLALFTGRWPDGRAWTLYETHGGGEGASARRDGTSAVRVHMSNVMNTPTEVIEAEYPLLVEAHELRDHSGGPGQHRGGLGLRRGYRLLADHARLTTMMERFTIPPWGLFGGAPGLGGRVTLDRSGHQRPIRGKETLELTRDDVIWVESAGGGGYGGAMSFTIDADTTHLESSSGRKKLENKVALLTGGAKGMGGTIAELFAREGASLVLAARDLDALDAELERIHGLIPELRGISVRCDVTDEAQVQAMVKRALDEFGQVDILVNAAGVTGPIETPVQDVPADAIDEVLAINVKGTILCCKALVPHMTDRRQGKIVNIAGTSGLRGYKNRVAYSASKWGVRGLTRTIALEVGSYGVNCNCVAPGPLFGPRMEKIIREKARVRGTTPEAIFDEYLSEQALKRFTSPVDIAYAVLFLSTDESRQITGQVITVDGGWDV